MKVFIFTIFINSFLLTFSQTDSTNLVKYDPGYKFKEGLYVNFEQVRNNNPIPKSRLVSTYDYNETDFFDNILAQNKVYYYDNIGNRSEIPTDKVWGFSRNGAIFIKVQEGYYRITLIGSVCHFVAMQTNYSNYYASPYYYNPYYDPYMGGHGSYPSSEMRQFLLDFKTGKVYNYSIDGIEVILMGDPELHDEFMALKKRKKRQSLFLYMRKYNERNPLYFPKTKS